MAATTERRDVIGRLAKRPYEPGDPLPALGTECLVSGANCDVQSDQHRSYSWRTVISYTDDRQFVCMQTKNCWPTVERVANCWFAEIPTPMAPAPVSSNQQLRDLLTEWDGLKYANEVMRTDGIGFDVILTRRALVMERIIETARAVVAVETGCVHPLGMLMYHGFVSGRVGDYRCEGCQAIVYLPSLDSREWAAARAEMKASTPPETTTPLCPTHRTPLTDYKFHWVCQTCCAERNARVASAVKSEVRHVLPSVAKEPQ
jgi:hypothetical protein